jgi:hypothetical protein
LNAVTKRKARTIRRHKRKKTTPELPPLSSRWVCSLTYDEVAALSNYGIKPSCEHHEHLSFYKALKMITSDLACTVGEDVGLNAIVEHRSNGYVWKTRSSAGTNVRQMVRLVQG